MALSYPDAVLALKPVAYWRLSEPSGASASDASGNGYTGTYVATVTQSQPGAMALDPATSTKFDGVTARVTTALPAMAQGANAALTVAGWAKRNTNTTGDVPISTDAGTSVNQWILRWVLNTSNVEFFATGNIGSAFWTGVLPATGTWFHFALAYIDITRAATLYINGTSQGTLSTPSTFPPSSGNVELGARAGGTDPYDGWLQDISYWATALRADQIAGLYAASQMPPDYSGGAHTPIASGYVR